MRWVPTAALLAFLVTACRLPGTVRPTVKIGLVAPFEGRYRYVGYDAIYGVQLALYEANEDGGVGGYGVELVAYDDGADQVMAVEQAGKLGVDPDVVGAIGHFREETTVAAGAIYGEEGIPLLAAALLNTDVGSTGDGTYRLGPTADRLGDVLMDRILQLAPGGDAVVVGRGGTLEQSVQRIARDRVGRELLAVSVDAEDWEIEVMNRDPAVVVCDLDAVDAGEAATALREKGWTGQLLGGPELGADHYFAVAGVSAVGTVFVTPWPFPADVPGGDAFAAAYGDVSDGSVPGLLALPAYEAAWVLLEALELAAADGRVTREGVRAALAEAEERGILARRAVDDGRVRVEWGLYWYRIGPGGVPALLTEH